MLYINIRYQYIICWMKLETSDWSRKSLKTIKSLCLRRFQIAGCCGDEHTVSRPQHEDLRQDPVHRCVHDVCRGGQANSQRGVRVLSVQQCAVLTMSRENINLSTKNKTATNMKTHSLIVLLVRFSPVKFLFSDACIKSIGKFMKNGAKSIYYVHT